MSTDLLALLRRDHHDLDRGLAELLGPVSSVAQLRTTLDGVRLGLTAHAEAEDIVLYRVGAALVELEPLVAEDRLQHLVQERALAGLVCATPGTASWRGHAQRLRDLLRDHMSYEECNVIAAIRELAPKIYDGLAGAFATERMRQLAMLQPSAPIYVPDLPFAAAS